VLIEELAPLRTLLRKLVGHTCTTDGEMAKRIRMLPIASRPVSAEHFQTVCIAMLERNRLDLTYYSRTRDEEMQRIISPQRLVHYRDNWYLELEPASEVARNELAYIADLRREREAKKKEIPWFLHSLLKPPTNALTVRLLALVEGMPSIPGPKTVGAENYSRIVDAFMKNGWEGFEDEFDRIVDPARPDYADVKRDLLCEPLFSIRYHKNLAELVSGEKTIDEIWEENRKHEEREPQ
jgi:hypothetical protein